MKIRRLLVLSAAPLLLADYTGIPARDSSADYAAHADSATVSLGVSGTSSAQVRKIFDWDWTSRYIFLEVALYPQGGKRLTVSPHDFMLRVGESADGVSPVDADAIEPLPKPMSTSPGAPPAVNVQVRETIGYSSGNGSNGPGANPPGANPPGANNRGIYTDSQAGVAVDNRGTRPNPPSTTTDKNADLHRALLDDELPDIKTSKPVAGYLYFPKPKGMKKGDPLELKYYGETERLTVSVPVRK